MENLYSKNEFNNYDADSKDKLRSNKKNLLKFDDLYELRFSKDLVQNEESRKDKENKHANVGYVDNFHLYLKNIGDINLLTASEELALAKKIANGDLVARKTMIESNLRLVINVAKHYLHKGLSLDDLIEEGNIGLIIATDKFDPEKGFRFATYATWWIRQAITRAVMNTGRTIRIPVHVWKEINEYQGALRDLTKELEREPNLHELGQSLKQSKHKIRELSEFSKDVLSLDAPLNNNEDSESLASTIQVSEQDEPFTIAEQESIKQLITTLLSHLESDSQVILIKRFGLNDQEPMSLEEISTFLNSSREKVRVMQNNALKKLRSVLIKMNV